MIPMKINLATKLQDSGQFPKMQKAVPFNESSEKAAISAILENNKNLEAMSWPEDLFFIGKHRTILAAAKKCHESGSGKNDFFAVQSELERTGLLESIGSLAEYITNAPSDPETTRWHRAYLVDSARYRNASKILAEAQESFRDETGDIGSVSLALSECAAALDKPRKTTRDHLGDLISELEDKVPTVSYGTGIYALDEIASGGVKPGELMTIAAETSGGKTILLLQIALEAMRANKHVLVFSLEMPAKKVFARFISNLCGFSINRIKLAVLAAKESQDAPKKPTEQNPIIAQQLNRFNAATEDIYKMNIQVESGYSDLDREFASQGKADLVIVDYLQLVHLRNMSSNETREQHVSEITRRLKAISLQLNLAIATASQLNEEGKLRESRAIGHHSDHVWLIRKGEDGPVVNIAKNRDGERDRSFPVIMRGDISRFEGRTK